MDWSYHAGEGKRKLDKKEIRETNGDATIDDRRKGVGVIVMMERSGWDKAAKGKKRMRKRREKNRKSGRKFHGIILFPVSFLSGIARGNESRMQIFSIPSTQPS